MGGLKVSETDSKDLPFVSICTPTFNRRPFWPMAIKCFESYTYPKDRMEWIIVDDGTDSIEDLVKDIPQVRYFRIENQMVLGRKRNFMHDQAKGDIFVYQDDDDYYPPTRISHCVEKLMENPETLAGGSTVLYLYFKHINQMYRFGPYGPNHATAGTFAFKRELAETSRYDDHAALAEEKSFLKNYSVPFVQFDPMQTILVFSHIHNTFDKKELLKMAPNPTCNPDMSITVEQFVKDPEILKFFMEDIDGILEKYEPGDVRNKPEVVNQIELINKQRENQYKEMNEIRMKTMENEDVKKVIAEFQNQGAEIQKNYGKMQEVNRRLCLKMKEMNNFVAGVLDADQLKEIETIAATPAPVNIEVSEVVFTVVQDESRKGINPDSLNQVMGFVGSNQLSLKLKVNNSPEAQPFSVNNVPLQFEPHKDEAQQWAALQQGGAANAQLQQSTPQVNLGGGQKASDEDIDTVVEQTGVTKEEANRALLGSGNDVITAIMNIDDFKGDATVASGTVSEDDVKTVIDQTNVSRDVAVKALIGEGNDTIAAIMCIDNYTQDNVELVVSET
tara:strand:+ start:14747 stop:16426 length:1680 start_codon:yes stop_codon:yes gene_type:complete